MQSGCISAHDIVHHLVEDKNLGMISYDDLLIEKIWISELTEFSNSQKSQSILVTPEIGDQLDFTHLGQIQKVYYWIMMIGVLRPLLCTW